ncbi:MAG TPA: PQQ-binding-like beta-propeller repeat protein, partial [Planctomycetota bacterium]|nr:PQQ-binding-like beta-propeller repeat protein [Planctomycetota bacterium]
WSSMILVDGFLVTQEQRGESEAVVAYDSSSGREIWSHDVSARFTEGIAGAGPRATPSFSGGRIYAVGGSGLLCCLEAPSGKVLWSHDLVKEAGSAIPHWGISSSPLVVGEKVVVFAGKVLAFESSSGKLAWSRDAGKESYSSPQLVRLLGKPQIVMHDLLKLEGLAVEDGSVLWERPGDGETAVPMLQPHPVGEGALLVSTKAGLARLEFKEEQGKWIVAEAWVSRRFTPSFNDFVVHDGHIYGLDNGVLACLDARTGERVWKKGRCGYGQVLLLEDQGVLLVLSEEGELGLVEARPQEPAEVPLLRAIHGKTWNHLAIAGDRLFVRNAQEMACFRLAGLQGKAQ